MPIIHVHMGKRPQEQLNRLGREMTEAAARVLDVKPNTIRILFHEIARENWFVGGMSLPDYYKNVLEPQAKAEEQNKPE
ncbi:MAG TPA: tautomerase family protein [Magnetospirillaceae bacterium]